MRANKIQTEESSILPFVETKEILEFLNSKKIFEKYLPHMKWSMVKHKMRGKDGNKKPIDFTESEKQQIIEAVEKFARDIKH
jgi:hypothetical protein